MPDPVNTGTKSPAGVPPAGTGAAEGQTPSASTGSPPENDLEFEDDQVVEQDGKKMVPLEAMLGEREKWKKRVAAEAAKAATPQAPVEPEPATEPEPPLFNWEKLMPQQGGQQTSPQPVGTQGPPPLDPNQFEDHFREMINDKPWQAIMWAIQTGMQYRDRMEGQARQFVPDYTSLPVHEVSDQEVQMLASNPYAMKAMIARAKAGGKQRAAPAAQQSVAQAASSQPAPAVSQDAVKAAMDMILSMGKRSGVSGEGTSGPSTPPAAASAYELDKESVAYFKARGYTEDQIKEQAKKIVEIRRRKGQVV
jgi:hypothetical protein